MHNTHTHTHTHTLALQLNMMVKYCEDDVHCRRAQLLELFEEKFSRKNCNKTCDNCATRGEVRVAFAGCCFSKPRSTAAGVGRGRRSLREREREREREIFYRLVSEAVVLRRRFRASAADQSTLVSSFVKRRNKTNAGKVTNILNIMPALFPRTCSGRGARRHFGGRKYFAPGRRGAPAVHTCAPLPGRPSCLVWTRTRCGTFFSDLKHP